MKCKRCGCSLPSTGLICRNCSAMMSMEQINNQKENQKYRNKNFVEMVSEKYGHKKQIFEKREEEKSKYIPLLFAASIMIVFFLLLLVYL